MSVYCCIEIMSKKKLSEKQRTEIIKRDNRKKKENDTSTEQVSVVSEFVRDFVRRHVITSRRSQSDLSWRPGSNISHNINLLPQSTLIYTPKKKTSISNDILTKVKHRNVRKKSLLKSIIDKPPSTIPSNLPLQLNHLWNDYFRSIISPSHLTTYANIANNLDTVLRMNLSGAKLKVVRSKSCRAGIEGIVVMETKNTFSLALISLKSQSLLNQSSLPLNIIPKIGSLFCLILPIPNVDDKYEKVDILLSGDCLAYRSVDRVIRKWRYTPTTAYEYNQNVLTTEAIFSDVLIDNRILG
ncbi:unnamed protein product [Heterobilharzia americana]|nr:unnamed protein product [Heterobilharzia americana]